jgi:hypothetical protein
VTALYIHYVKRPQNAVKNSQKQPWHQNEPARCSPVSRPANQRAAPPTTHHLHATPNTSHKPQATGHSQAASHKTTRPNKHQRPATSSQERSQASRDTPSVSSYDYTRTPKVPPSYVGVPALNIRHAVGASKQIIACTSKQWRRIPYSHTHAFHRGIRQCRCHSWPLTRRRLRQTRTNLAMRASPGGGCQSIPAITSPGRRRNTSNNGCALKLNDDADGSYSSISRTNRSQAEGQEIEARDHTSAAPDAPSFAEL